MLGVQPFGLGEEQLTWSPLTVEAEPLRLSKVFYTFGSPEVWFYRSYQIYKKFYVRINFIKLILQKIRSSTCKGDRGATAPKV
jgi:hypothetical protein